jgi:serine/threonine-protein kinase
MNRMVAVKILHPKLTNRKDLVSRFRREARAMSHLTHPNTVKVFLYGDLDDGSLYIVMEYLDGKNLNQVVRKEGPMAIERAIPVLIQVCGALQEAHLQGIIHRDLKPENIFLSTNGGLKDYPKVLDFGLAKVTERELRPGSIMLTQEGMVFGTPEFMSPEQAQGKPLDARSDLYSLAIILYEVLTGKLPFDARTPMEYIQMHVTKPPILLDDRVPGKRFPPGLGAVLNKALQKRPEDRYASAAEFAQALKPFAGLQGKGYTALMPKGTAESVLQSYPTGNEGNKPSDLLPIPVVVPSGAPPALNDAAMPRDPSAVAPRPPSLVQSPGAMPGSNYPPGAAGSLTPPRRRAAYPTTGMIVGIAAGCLVLGIFITVLALHFFG